MSQQEDEVRPLCAISTQSLLFCSSELVFVRLALLRNGWHTAGQLPRCGNQKSLTLCQSWQKSFPYPPHFQSWPSSRQNPVRFGSLEKTTELESGVLLEAEQLDPPLTLKPSNNSVAPPPVRNSGRMCAP